MYPHCFRYERRLRDDGPGEGEVPDVGGGAGRQRSGVEGAGGSVSVMATEKLVPSMSCSELELLHIGVQSPG